MLYQLDESQARRRMLTYHLLFSMVLVQQKNQQGQQCIRVQQADQQNFIQNTVYISLTVGYVRESTLLKLAKEYLDVLIHLLIESAVLSCPIRSLSPGVLGHLLLNVHRQHLTAESKTLRLFYDLLIR